MDNIQRNLLWNSIFATYMSGGGGRGGSNPVRQDRRETEENRF